MWLVSNFELMNGESQWAKHHFGAHPKAQPTVGLDVAVADGHVQSGGDHCVYDVTTAVQLVERLS